MTNSDRIIEHLLNNNAPMSETQVPEPPEHAELRRRFRQRHPYSSANVSHDPEELKSYLDHKDALDEYEEIISQFKQAFPGIRSPGLADPRHEFEILKSYIKYRMDLPTEKKAMVLYLFNKIRLKGQHPHSAWDNWLIFKEAKRYLVKPPQ